MDLDVVDEMHVHAGEEDEGDALEDETDEEDLIMIQKCGYVSSEQRLTGRELQNKPWNRDQHSHQQTFHLQQPTKMEAYSVNNNHPCTTVNIDIPERRKSTHPT